MPANITPSCVVDPAAAVLADVIDDPTPVKYCAAAAKSPREADTNDDICGS
jgi:hypothetical protein